MAKSPSCFQKIRVLKASSSTPMLSQTWSLHFVTNIQVTLIFIIFNIQHYQSML
ncbi:hypothetical protein ACGVWS_04050 [Enterobacteriaceae bacterium LUAb1]